MAEVSGGDAKGLEIIAPGQVRLGYQMENVAGHGLILSLPGTVRTLRGAAIQIASAETTDKPMASMKAVR